MKWDYVNRTVDISMPGYVNKALARFDHKAPARFQCSPFPWKKPEYGKKVQLTPETDTSRDLTPKEVNRIQQVVGVFLWYARGVDSTMTGALSAIATLPSKESAKAVVNHFLDYAACNPEAVVRFRKSDMQLKISSDAGYLVEPQARSRRGGDFYLGDRRKDPLKPPTIEEKQAEPPQGSILSTSHVIKEVCSSAAKAKISGVYHNAREGCPIRVTLEELGWKQDPTLIDTDNSTAEGFANKTIKQRRSKAIDMRYYWVQDRCDQGQYLVYWAPGVKNRADYFSKSGHPPSHHRAVRYDYLHPPHQANLVMRGCVDLAIPPIHDSSPDASSTADVILSAPSVIGLSGPLI
jgi:hypothetical protein